jgi:hypothetical protein
MMVLDVGEASMEGICGWWLWRNAPCANTTQINEIIYQYQTPIKVK